MSTYPEWFYYPSSAKPPDWALQFVEVVAASKDQIDSDKIAGLTSDRVLSILRPGLVALGYAVEAGKKKADKIERPVLFGANGRVRVPYQIDAAHDELGIIVEIEAGRGARGNAIYRDLVRCSLIVEMSFLVLGAAVHYRHQSSGKGVDVPSFRQALDLLDAVYASGRLRLPFEGVLLFGY